MFYFDSFYGKKILKSTLLKKEDCFFTTREFVLTPSIRTDLEEECKTNRNFLLDKFSSKNIYCAEQTHSANIEIIKKETFLYKNTDALISNIKNSVLLLNFADCVPIILYSEKDNTGALVHAGWRGTAQNITFLTVEKMKKELNINPKDIKALIGPAIGKCCFETNEDVFKQLIKENCLKESYTKIKDKYNIDLKLLNKQQLLNSGIINIDICNYCTCCMSGVFFSYRKEKGHTARHSAILKIRGDR